MQTLASDSRIGGLVCTNTIPIPPEKMHPKIVQISAAGLLADIIHRVHRGISISEKLVFS